MAMNCGSMRRVKNPRIHVINPITIEEQHVNKPPVHCNMHTDRDTGMLFVNNSEMPGHARTMDYSPAVVLRLLERHICQGTLLFGEDGTITVSSVITESPQAVGCYLLHTSQQQLLTLTSYSVRYLEEYFGFSLRSYLEFYKLLPSQPSA